jgi:hypothetical protein
LGDWAFTARSVEWAIPRAHIVLAPPNARFAHLYAFHFVHLLLDLFHIFFRDLSTLRTLEVPVLAIGALIEDTNEPVAVKTSVRHSFTSFLFHFHSSLSNFST